MTSTVTDTNSGRIVGGRFRLLERIGAGRTSTVYVARHPGSDRLLAVKLLRAELHRSSTALRRFRQEAELLGQLAHEHLVEIHEANVYGDDTYLVMPLLPGESLEALLRREGRVPWPRARELLLQVCRAVDHAHRHGVVHRDLKPANCFLKTTMDGHDHVVVLDFGIAKLLNPTGSPLTDDGDIVGTPGYLAPEQVESGEADSRTDVYATGALLFYMLAGRPPFVERGPELLVRLTSEPAPALRDVAATVDWPPHVDIVVARALARSANDRFPDMRALARALDGQRDVANAWDTWFPWCFWVGLPLLALLSTLGG